MRRFYPILTVVLWIASNAVAQTAPPPKPTATLNRLRAGAAKALDAGDAEKSEALFRRAIKLAPKDSGLHSGLAAALVAQGRHDEAEEPLRAACDLRVEKDICLSLLTDFLLKQGKTAAAIETARRRAVLAFGFDRSRAYIKLGEILERENRYGEARDAFRDADRAGGGILALHQKEFAERMARRGHFRIAIDTYREIASRDPLAAANLLRMIVENELWGELRSLRLMPGDVAPAYRIEMLAESLERKGDIDKAIKLLDLLAETDTRYPAFHHKKKGELLARQARWREAGAAFEAADRAGNYSGNFHVREFVKSLARNGRTAEVWETLRGVRSNAEWTIRDLDVTVEAIAAAAFQGDIQVVWADHQGLATSDCMDVKGTTPDSHASSGELLLVIAPGVVPCGDRKLPSVIVARSGKNWLAPLSLVKLRVAPSAASPREPPATQPVLTASWDLVRPAPGARSSPNSESPLDEVTLGFNHRQNILKQHPAVDGGKLGELVRKTFQSLTGTSTIAVGPSLPYEVTILNDNSVNAFATAGGKVYVNSGMIPVLGDNPGMWAAVLGHELGHGVGRHHYKAYMRLFEMQRLRAYYSWRAAMGDKWAGIALLGVRIGGDLLNMKLSRDDESEADYLGMKMMAEAGYHPDFAIHLQRHMHAASGDRSKLATFFSSGHPRWETREQRLSKAIAESMEIFSSRWTDAAESPGGLPPAIAGFGAVKATPDKRTGTVRVSAPFFLRHAKGSSARLEIELRQKGRPVPGSAGFVRPFEVTAAK
jgi:predicted Zn-dependent protease